MNQFFNTEDNFVTDSLDTLKSTKPNIILILSDDHGYGDLSFMNINEDVHTPNLDKLRESGIYFENGYVTAPICSPSRAGLMVGNYQQRWGAKWFGNSQFAPETYKTIPELLKMQGYRTGYFGKVHYGPDELASRSAPNNHGFDVSFYGLASHSYGRLHYLNHSLNPIEDYGEETHYLGMNPMYENGEAVASDTHLTKEFTDRTINFIKNSTDNDDSPFFTMLAFNAVHNFTWQLPVDELNKRGLPKFEDLDLSKIEYEEWYQNVISPNLEHGREYYLAQLEIMDEQIGRLIDYLEELNIRENTLVIYLTDNGGSPCNFGCNSPLSGSKYSLYEGGVRVPYIMSWPSVLQENQSSNALVSSLDFLPTFTYLAGVDPNIYKTDGKNLIEILLEDNGHERLYFDTGFQWAIREGDWKLRTVTETDGAEAYKTLKENEHADIGKPGTTLVNLNNNLDETDAYDLSDKNPDKREDLEEKYNEWLDAIENDLYLAD